MSRFDTTALRYNDPGYWPAGHVMLVGNPYQTGKISSTLMAPLFHFRILVAAEMAFSVGLTLVPSRESGAWMICTKLGIAVAQRDANPGPPN